MFKINLLPSKRIRFLFTTNFIHYSKYKEKVLSQGVKCMVIIFVEDDWGGGGVRIRGYECVE